MSIVPSSTSLQLSVTDAARTFMQRMVRFGGQGPQAGFWLQVSSGGCSGLSSSFEVRATPKETDAVVELPGLRLFVAGPSVSLLEGVTIDFADTRTESGLSFVDPKRENCACSTGEKGVQLGVM